MITSNPVKLPSNFVPIKDQCASSSKPGIHSTDLVPKNLDELIYLIRQEMGTKGLNSGDIDVNKVIRYMEEYQSNAEDWERYAFFDKNHYTRNLIDDGNGEYNLILLVWGQNQSSSIHNHAGSHCIMKILDGEVVESLYDCPNKDENSKDDEMNLTRELVFGSNQVAYIHDKIGLHKVSNPSSSRPAVSLHLYSPPILEAKLYNKETGESVTACQKKFYSKYGTKVDKN